MSSAPYHPSAAAAATLPHRSAAYRAPVAAPNAPSGTFVPGTKVQVGNHRVIIERYLSEGGFAHVYLVRVPKSGEKTDVAVLKRVAVPDKDALANMRTEVETMKKLKGHRHIVTYIDSHASQLKGEGYEVFLLMEYCAGGGLIDFMNTRLQHRLTEPEILKIFSDVAEGVACMHYLKPPLLHRDLKVENVLISASGSSRLYKLCDFGSTAPPRPAATTAAEGRLIEDDVQRHTTLQYRSPEMIDVYRKQPIDEKSDIWALGVLLYKLCYYTTPFEEVGQMAILNASFKFPSYPSFSDRTKKLIASMLRENPQQRPNIYQVIREVCSIRGVEVPIKDIYANRTQSEARRNEKLPPREPTVSSPPIVEIVQSPSSRQLQTIPDITPMRRGRPTAPSQKQPGAKPSPSMRGAASDPFAALDSTSAPLRAAAADELAARFPSLDEFSLLHEKKGKAPFLPSSPAKGMSQDLGKRVTEALADEAFVQPKSVSSTGVKASAISSRSASLNVVKPTEPRPAAVTQSPLVHQPVPNRPGYTSTGTMTSPSPPLSGSSFTDIKQRPIFRFPPSDHHRSSSQPRASDSAQIAGASLKLDLLPRQRSPLLGVHRTESPTATLTTPQPSASSRPSLEGRRPSNLEIGDTINRSKSATARPRPSSVHVESDLDYLRERETSKGRGSLDIVRSKGDETEQTEVAIEETNIASDVDFLRTMEGSETSDKRKDRRRSNGNGSKHRKRASMPSISLSNTKSILAGKFGDAFRRFEGSGDTPVGSHRTPSPGPDKSHTHGVSLTPITGSEATGGTSDHESALDETQDLPPEMKREMERRRLSQEEKRVADAAAEYRKRIADQPDGGRGRPSNGSGFNKASTIQNRVRTLLDESQQPSRKKMAEGYGHFAEKPPPPSIARKPDLPSSAAIPADLSYSKPRRQPLPMASVPVPSASAPPTAQRIASRPSAPPKPKALRTGNQAEPPLPNVVLLPDQRVHPASGAVVSGGKDWEVDFSKKYPDLSSIELVETEIEKGRPAGSMRVKDV